MVDDFLPGYVPANLYLDPKDPLFINGLVPPEDFSEMRYQQRTGFEKALEVIPEVQREFLQAFGRRYEMVEAYRCEDADVVVVTLGSMSGTTKHVVNELRANDLRVGAVKIGVFRPFPSEELRTALGGKRVVGVVDRSAGLGAQGGPVWLEVSAAVSDRQTRVFGYVAGLGGRDVTETTVRAVFDELLQISDRERLRPAKSWIDTRDNAMQLRMVEESERRER
jgi:pyruvate ferredoxin oxidoreductase alpha subunit